MASRKDGKGRVLRKGEAYRKKSQMYSYSYYDPLGKRHFVYSKDLTKLREKEAQLQKDQLDGIDSYVAGNKDLNFVFDRYMATKNELRISTKASYSDVYNRYVRSELGVRKLADIKYSDLLFFYTSLMENQELHIGTIEYIQRLIHPALELAVRDNVIRNNPSNGVLKGLKSKNLQDGRYIRHALTLEQQRAFLSYLDEDPLNYRWKPLFTVMIGTGMRIGEVVGLRWEDIDLESKKISVNHSMFYYAGTRNKESQKWVVNLPKTEAGIRTIPMVEPVYIAFLEEKARQDDEGVVCRTDVDGMSGFIFCNRFNEIHNAEAINRKLQRLVENYNNEEVKAVRERRKPVLLPHFTCHHLRHTFCARLCEAETNIKVIQSVMGHKDIQTTLDIYAEVTDSKKRSTLDELFNDLKLF